MSREIKTYSIRIYGGPEGDESTRAEIRLHGPRGEVWGYLSFHDSGVILKEDSVVKDIAYMHLPSALLHSVVDMLRNEEPIWLMNGSWKPSLTTGMEPVGEGE